MYYVVKVTERWTHVVKLEADNEEVAKLKAKDGYGQGVTLKQCWKDAKVIDVDNPGQQEFDFASGF